MRGRTVATKIHLFRKTPVFLLLILMGIVTAYAPTFRGEFILDDKPFVKDNPSVQGLKPLISYFLQEDGIVGDLIGRAHSGYYRPLVNITYSLDFILWESNAAGFRITNLALHLITCLVLYLSMRRILKEETAPLIAVLLFGLHPVNTETVAWVSSRNNILVSLFSIASFYFYVRRAEENKRWLGFLSLTFFALALLSKEFAVMLLPIFFIYDFLMRRDGRSRRGTIWAYLAFLCVLIGYLLLRKNAIHDLVPARHSIGDLWSGLCFAPYLLVENARLIFLPSGLHNFIMQYPQGWFGKEGVAGIVGMILIFAILWKWRNIRILLFSTLSFILALFPVLNILPTSAHSLVAMRWLYFPMCFLILAVAWLVSLAAKTGRRRLMYGAAAAVVLYLGGYTYILNDHLWKKEEDLFLKEVMVFGNMFYAGDLGRIYQIKGDYHSAVRYYDIALRNLTPDRLALLINHAALMIQVNRPEAALESLAEAEGLNPGRNSLAMIYQNRGCAFLNMKEFSRAIESFHKALSFSPGDPSIRSNLEKALQMEQGDGGGLP